MTTKSPILVLREALQYALDELRRINDQYSCVRPDVTFAASDALWKTFLAPIPNASEIEQRIVGRVVNDLLAAGYQLSVFDGEETTVKRSTDVAEIFPALASTDIDLIEVYRAELRNRQGYVQLVWGNDADVIADYSTKLEDILSGANAVAEALS